MVSLDFLIFVIAFMRYAFFEGKKIQFRSAKKILFRIFQDHFVCAGELCMSLLVTKVGQSAHSIGSGSNYEKDFPHLESIFVFL